MNPIKNISLNNINKVSKPGEKPMTLEDKIIDMVKKVAERSEREVPEYGDFKPVKESIVVADEKYFAKNFDLSVIKMSPVREPDPKARYIKVSMTAPDNSVSEMLVKTGYKKDIMEELKSEIFPNKMFKYFRQVEDALKHA
ncbi:MAG: hypothetical protein LKG27_03835 [Clostridiaceae bacterium]|jgi:hypothetical protein|nr:hypothetical protein [Clostridiaceae bacterium]